MSKSITSKTQFYDRDVLVDALAEHVCAREHIEIHNEPVEIRDYAGRVIGRANIAGHSATLGSQAPDRKVIPIPRFINPPKSSGRVVVVPPALLHLNVSR